MRLQQVTLHLVGILLTGLALLVWPGMSLAQESVTVKLDPIGGSGVSGMATLTRVGEGTQAVLDLQGLAPGITAQARMQANTCAMPSASFATLPDLTADATGRATATGSVLFRGTDNVALTTMADGAHIIAIQTGQMVACGVIPAAPSVSGPSTLPGTGGAALWLMPAIMAILGLCALSAGLFLWGNRWLRRF